MDNFKLYPCSRLYRQMSWLSPLAQLISTRVFFTNAGIKNEYIYGRKKDVSIYMLVLDERSKLFFFKPS